MRDESWVELLQLAQKVRGPEQALAGWAEQWKTTLEGVLELGTPSRGVLITWIARNATVAAVFGLTEAKTSDQLVMKLMAEQRWGEVLALHTPLNHVPLDIEFLSEWDSELTARWFNAGFYLKMNLAMVAPWAERKLKQRAKEANQLPEAVSLFNDLAYIPYFTTTYFEGGFLDRTVRQRINQDIERSDLVRGLSIDNQPQAGHVAIVSGGWWQGHPIHDGLVEGVRRLCATHNCTLLLTRVPGAEIDTLGFERVEVVTSEDGIAMDSLLRNNFSLALFTDIGLNLESIVLANLRFAPIQVGCHGHPASSFGAKIDYWLTGYDIERSPQLCEDYSEQPVLIHGNGFGFGTRSVTSLPEPPPSEVVRVACAWSTPKISSDMLHRLETIGQRSTQPVEFLIFTTNLSDRSLDLAAARRGLRDLLRHPHRIRLLPLLPRDQYLSMLRNCHLGLDAYPFSGFGSLFDFLEAGRPILTWKGYRAAGRQASSYLERLGFDELVATDEASFINKALDLIQDPQHRAQLSARIAQCDLSTPGRLTAEAFAEALRRLEAQWLIEQGHPDDSTYAS